MRRRRLIRESGASLLGGDSAPSPLDPGQPSETDVAAFNQVSLTTEEAKATLAVLRAVRNVLIDADGAAFTDFDSDILTTAADRIAEELPEFTVTRAERLSDELAAWLEKRAETAPETFGRHGDEKPPFPVQRNRRVLKRAFDRGLAAEIEYYVRSREEWTVRRVDIEDVFEDEDTWYLEGYCRLRRDHRLFRLDNIRAVRIPGEDSPDDIADEDGDEADPFADE